MSESPATTIPNGARLDPGPTRGTQILNQTAENRRSVWTFGPSVDIDPAAEQFRGPGAPFGIWVGVRYSFGTQSAGAEKAD